MINKKLLRSVKCDVFFFFSDVDDFWENLPLTRARRGSFPPSASSLDVGPMEILSAPSIVKNVTADEVTSENITAQLGSSIFLNCKTHHSMERQVRRHFCSKAFSFFGTKY